MPKTKIQKDILNKKLSKEIERELEAFREENKEVEMIRKFMEEQQDIIQRNTEIWEEDSEVQRYYLS